MQQNGEAYDGLRTQLADRIPAGAQQVAQIEILSEAETGAGWSFDAQVLDDVGDLHRFTIRLSWADYSLWSRDGADTPASVGEAALAFWLSRESADSIPASFDASRLRRLFADADERITAMVQRHL